MNRIPVLSLIIMKIQQKSEDDHSNKIIPKIQHGWFVEDFIAEYKNFSSEAIEQIYAATDGDMRKFEEICIECQDKAKELKYSLVDINLALTVLTDLPSNH